MLLWSGSLWADRPEYRPGEVTVIDRRFGQTPEDRKLRSALWACDHFWKTLTPEQRVTMMFITFHSLVVRDGIDPQVAHKAFCAIDEYADSIAPDINGAKHSGDTWGGPRL